MKLVYDVNDKPKFSQTLLFGFQQMIAIMAATLLVPMIVSGYTMSDGSQLQADPAAALLGAGVGTLVYILCTRRKSPVFLGSSFTFLGAYAASIQLNYGYWGMIIGVAFAGLVYVIIALVIKLVGSGWVNRIMPNVIIGPIVALIGLSLSGTATSWVMGNGEQNILYSAVTGPEIVTTEAGELAIETVTHPATYSWIAILVGLVTFFVIVLASVKGTKNMKLIPFIIGVGAGYVLALILTLIGRATGIEALQIMSFKPFINTFGNFSITSIVDYPKFFFLKAIQTNGTYPLDAAAIGNIAMIYVPIGIVELAQHIADHKNLSSIIEKDLITDPGLDKTLLGDGLGSIVGSLFGGAANTTYGESIGCVAITGNASIVSIIVAALGCIVLAFFSPFVAVIHSIPKCVMGGACIAMYGFIAVSGLQMIQKVDLNNSKNLFVVAAILVCGIGGLFFGFGTNTAIGGPLLQITALAAALIVGIITNLLVGGMKKGNKEE